MQISSDSYWAILYILLICLLLVLVVSGCIYYICRRRAQVEIEQNQGEML